MTKKTFTKFVKPSVESKLKGLTKHKKEFKNCSFRLGVEDRRKLSCIATFMNDNSQQKVMTLTDAIKAAIEYAYNANPVDLIDCLAETL
jgi:hypothetical protein